MARNDRGDSRNGGSNAQQTIKMSPLGDTLIVQSDDQGYRIFSRGGPDTIITGSGWDTVYGEDGDDLILSTGGRDYQFGGEGNDTHIFGEWGTSSSVRKDTVTQVGGEGNDALYVNDAYKATQDGGAGDDLIHSWSVHTTAYGGAGNDIIAIAGGRAFGGLGADIFKPLNDWVHGDKIHLVLRDFTKGDKIDFSWLSKYDEGLGYYRPVQEWDATYADGIIEIEGVGTIEVDLGKGVDDIHEAVLVGIANFQPEDFGGKG